MTSHILQFVFHKDISFSTELGSISQPEYRKLLQSVANFNKFTHFWRKIVSISQLLVKFT